MGCIPRAVGAEDDAFHRFLPSVTLKGLLRYWSMPFRFMHGHCRDAAAFFMRDKAPPIPAVRRNHAAGSAGMAGACAQGSKTTSNFKIILIAHPRNADVLDRRRRFCRPSPSKSHFRGG